MCVTMCVTSPPGVGHLLNGIPQPQHCAPEPIAHAPATLHFVMQPSSSDTTLLPHPTAPHRLKSLAGAASPSLSPEGAAGRMSHSCTSSACPAAAAAAAAVPGLNWSPTSPISLILRLAWCVAGASAA